ncbi:MAG TPA: hypothetical protein VMJ10_01895 [Kofleriaceae bacterium]|nr:hypothetical protein [Kofleriaceae bacterium]
MASALDTIAHVVLPNLMKLKGAATLVSAIERRDPSPFQQVWSQTGVAHTPQVIAKERDAYRIGVLSLPKPTQMGEAHLCAFVAKKNDAAVTRYFTLEYDYVLATKTERSVLCERDGSITRKIGEGPKVSGDFQTDAAAFVDAVMNVVDPPLVVDSDRNYR